MGHALKWNRALLYTFHWLELSLQEAEKCSPCLATPLPPLYLWEGMRLCGGHIAVLSTRNLKFRGIPKLQNEES